MTETLRKLFAALHKSIDDGLWVTGEDDGREHWCVSQSRVRAAIHALEHGIEHECKSEFHRGYECGKHSYDADRMAVVIRLRETPLGCGSHGDLSAIARCVYDPHGAWTIEACKNLHDELIRLMGGARDGELCETVARNGHESANSAENLQIQAKEGDKAYPFATYDELGNERHKAVCELRKLDGCSPLAHSFRDELAAAIDVPRDGAPYSNKELCHLICDRLIYLLDGTQDGHSRTCPKCDDDVSESDDNVSESDHVSLDTPSSITSELRKYAKTQAYPHNDRLRAVADRMDAQFERICSQQEAVLQQTISETVDEHKREMAELRHDMEMWRDRSEDMRMERDELRERVERLKEKCDNQREQLDTYNTLYDFDAIRRLKLERGSYKHRAECAEGKAESTRRRLAKTEDECAMYRQMLNDAADEYRALMDEHKCCREERDRYMSVCLAAQRLNRDMMDGLDGYIELPKDANGEYVHIGDGVDDKTGPEPPFGVHAMMLLDEVGWVLLDRIGTRHNPDYVRHVGRRDFPESIVRDLSLGSITESEACERIGRLTHGD